MRWTRSLVLVYANVTLYALCFQLQRPIEPFLVERLGAKGSDAALSYGSLQSFFSVMQTFGSLTMGMLLDRLGARWCFVICFLSSAASYCLLSVSTSLPLLYLSKVPTFFQAGFLVAQAFIAQETSLEDRPDALGRATTAYTLGATVGPLVGGWLGASGDYYLGARLAVAGSLLSVVLSLLLPTATGSQTKAAAPAPTPAPAGQAGLQKMLAVAMRPTVLAILATKLYASIGTSIGQTAFPLVLKNGFGVTEQGMGVAMSSMMLLNSAVGAFVVGPFTRLLQPRVMAQVCVLGKGCCEAAAVLVVPGSALLSWLPAAVHSSLPYVTLHVVLSGFQFALATTLSVVSTSSVAKDEQGSLMGAEHAMFAASRIGTPTLSTYLFSGGGVFGVAGTCAAISGTLLIGVRMISWPRCGDQEKGQ